MLKYSKLVFSMLIFCGLTIHLGAGVSEYRTNRADPLIRNMPQSIRSFKPKGYEIYLQKVAEYITEHSVDEYDKVKKTHDWVALNISYNAAAFFSGRIPDQSVSRVVSSGLAVCSGYAELFNYLCGVLDIECEIVTGYARGYNRALFGEERPYENHAWNKVRINGESYLIDTTWDSGYVSGRSFTRSYKTDYLFANPEYFIYDHFPNSQEDQLLVPPMKAEDFVKLPLLNPSFFDHTANFSPRLQRVTEVRGRFLRIDFDAQGGRHFMLDLFSGRGNSKRNNAINMSTRNGKHTVTIAFPSSGDYTLRFYSSLTSIGTHYGIGDFGFTVELPEENPELIPGDAEILFPEGNSVERAHETTFRVNPGKWKYIAVVSDNNYNNWQYLSPDEDGVFTANLTLYNTGKYHLAASETEAGVYETLMTFTVR